MRLTETSLPGAYVIDLDPVQDDRGWFERTFDADAFASQKLETQFVQHSVSFNRARGTLRGLHYQSAPFEETKVIRCVAGAIHDVIVDLRPESTAFRTHIAIELSAGDHRQLYVPAGIAHGFLTLEDATSVSYLISQPYSAEHARGVRWNDPALAIRWPFQPAVISARDTSFADFRALPR